MSKKSSPPVRIQLTQPQADFLDSPATYRGFVGGRGAGKSFIGAYDLFKRVRPNRLYMIAAPTYPMLRDTTLRSFKAMASTLGREFSFAKGDGIITLSNGADILLRTTNEPERMRGPNLSGIWMDEASLMTEEAYEIAIPSLREAGQQGWLSLTFTPKGKAHWTYKRLGMGAEDTHLVHSHTSQNPFLPDNFVETITRQYGSGLLAQQELGGEFLDMGDTEWPSSYFERPDFWYADNPTRRKGRFLFYDGAGNPKAKTGDWHAAALLTITDDGHLWFDNRLWHGPQEVAAKILVDLCREFAPDACGIETNFGGDIMLPLIGYVSREQGWPELVGRFGGVNNFMDKNSRIRRLGSNLAAGRIHLRDTPGGRETLRQLEQFPLCDHDDAPDAMDGAVQVAASILKPR